MAKPSEIIPIKLDKKYINMMLYGDPGVGKTPLAGTSPKALFLADPEGMESAAAYGTDAEQWVMRDFSDLEEAYEYLRHAKHGYQWIWWDTITLFEERGMDQMMEDLLARNPNRDRYVPDQPQYLQVQNRLSHIVRRFVELPVNFGIIAHVMDTEDRDGDIVHMPAIQGGQGRLSNKICANMGIIAYMETVHRKNGSDDWVLYTSKRKNFYARDRFQALGSRLINPTIPEIASKVRAKVGSRPTRKTTKTTKASRRRTSR